MSVAHETSGFDNVAAEAFLARVCDLLNEGATAIMISIGHRLGLFDALATLPPATSAEIAAATGLTERYVREWLASMVTGGIVLYDPASRSYSLPAEHAACLTHGAPLGNMAVYAQHVALLGAMQDRALDLFRHGGGTRYGEYPCFHQIMAEDSGQTVMASLFETVLPLVDELTDRLERGIEVLDAGCGRGSALIAMAERFPASRFTGYDFSEDAVAFANEEVRRKGLANIVFETRDLTGYDETDRFDFIATFDAVHDQKDPQGLVRGIHGALRTGGVYLMQDIGGSARLENNMDFPMASMLYAVSCLHCTPISIGQGGEGLGTMWGWETAEAMLRGAGFDWVVSATCYRTIR